MSRSQRIAISAIAFAAVITALLFWFLPIFPWWIYGGVFVIITGIANSTWLATTALSDAVDRDRG